MEGGFCITLCVCFVCVVDLFFMIVGSCATKAVGMVEVRSVECSCFRLIACKFDYSQCCYRLWLRELLSILSSLSLSLSCGGHLGPSF